MVDVYGGSKVFQQNVRLRLSLAASTSMSGSGARGGRE